MWLLLPTKCAPQCSERLLKHHANCDNHLCKCVIAAALVCTVAADPPRFPDLSEKRHNFVGNRHLLEGGWHNGVRLVGVDWFGPVALGEEALHWNRPRFCASASTHF